MVSFDFFILFWFHWNGNGVWEWDGTGMECAFELRGGAGAALRSPAAWAKLPRGLRGVSWRPKKIKKKTTTKTTSSLTTFLTFFFAKKKKNLVFF